MVDQIFIGQGVGYLGNGATNVIFPLMQVAIAIALLLGEGGANYISLKLGSVEKEKEKASKAMAAGIVSLFGGRYHFRGLYHLHGTVLLDVRGY